MPLHLPAGSKLVAATHNPGKAREIAALLEGRFEVIPASALGLAEPHETEATFTGNALLKARAAADVSGLPALADDSGLSVRGLDGAPGIFSARWAGPEKDFSVAMKKVEARLVEVRSDDRAAWFTCALALAWPNGPAWWSRGELTGPWSSPAVETAASATTRSSSPRAGPRPLANWTPPPRTP